MKRLKLSLAILATSVLLSSSLNAEMKAPFGGHADVSYAKNLWNKIEAKGLNSTPSNLYVGGPPHGKVREVLEAMIDGKRVVVKRNYGGKDITIKKVAQNRDKYLKAITVMAKREKGYDNDNANWFWVKYTKNGDLMKNPKGMKLAGKVAKGMPVGCIACHASASGSDYVFKHNLEADAILHVK